MQEMFTFDDVLIVPKFSKIESRKDVDTSVICNNFPYIGLPVISANMDTVTGSEMAKAMLDAGGQAVLHRFCSIEENVKMFLDSLIERSTEYSAPFVSIGLGSSELERASALKDAGAQVFVIDVAHGAQLSVVKQVKSLKDMLGPNSSIVVGNFASANSVSDFLEYTKVDGIKVGVGPGSTCVTRVKTGVGYPQLSAVLEIANLLKNCQIAVIADGGMRTPGDIAKAIGAGAHMVMLGGMLAGTFETPGELFYVNDSGRPIAAEDFLAKDNQGNLIRDEYSESFKKAKKYRGSASKESYEAQGKAASWRTSEGESFLVPYKGPVKDILQDIEGGLRSSMSYVGASNIREFQEKCEFVRITPSTVVENSAHGKKQ